MTMTTHEAQAEAPIGIGELLKLRDFRLLWIGQALSVFGDSLTALALLVLINQVTGSVAAVATMAIVMALPQVVFGLIAGVYVDRADRKRLMIVSDVLRGLLVLGFVLFQTADQIWLLYLLGFLQAMVGTFFLPARSAITPLLVPERALLAANSLNETSRIVCGLLGTAAAGVIFAVFGSPWMAFVIDAATFVVSAGLLALMRVPQLPSTGAGHAPGGAGAVLGQLGEGVGLILRSRLLSGALVAAGVTMLGFGAVNVLIVPFVLNDLGAGETWFAGLNAAQTAAMILSGAAVTALATKLQPTSMVTLALIATGALVAAVALVPNVWWLLGLLFLIGLCVTPLQASIATIVQTAVENNVRGRVGAALSTLISSMNLLSMGLAGGLGALVGVRNVFVLAGGLAIVAGLAGGLVFRERGAGGVRRGSGA